MANQSGAFSHPCYFQVGDQNPQTHFISGVIPTCCTLPWQHMPAFLGHVLLLSPPCWRFLPQSERYCFSSALVGREGRAYRKLSRCPTKRGGVHLVQITQAEAAAHWCVFRELEVDFWSFGEQSRAAPPGRA